MWNTVVFDVTGKIKDSRLSLKLSGNAYLFEYPFITASGVVPSIPLITSTGSVTLSEITASSVAAIHPVVSSSVTMSEVSATGVAWFPPTKQAAGNATQPEITASGVVPTVTVSQFIPPISITVGGGQWDFSQYIDDPNNIVISSQILNLNTNFATYDGTPGSETLTAVADSGTPMTGLQLEVTY